jgi:hypothetical protein
VLWLNSPHLWRNKNAAARSILLVLFLLFAPCGPWSSQLSQDCIVYKAGMPDVGDAIPMKRTMSALERVQGFRRKI